MEGLGVKGLEDLRWLDGRLTAHPWLTYNQPVAAAPLTGWVPGMFIHCTDWVDVFASQAAKARAAGWPVQTLPTGHEAMVTAPDRLAEILDGLAGGDTARAEITIPRGA